MRDDGLSPFSRELNLAGSSPPSPESDFDPILFMAIANVSWASGLNAPNDIPGANKRFRISYIFSTSSLGMFFLLDLKFNKSRILIGWISSISIEYFLYRE